MFFNVLVEDFGECFTTHLGQIYADLGDNSEGENNFAMTARETRQV